MSERTTDAAKKASAGKSGAAADRIPVQRQAYAPAAEGVELLQRMAGNQAVVRMFRTGALRPKLAVSGPGDVHEREADRVADEVMRMPEPALQMKPG